MKYSLGLDIGTTSIGWAVIDEDNKRIHDLGVRIFDRAEHGKGDSPAKPRRDARSSRRRLKRRRQRLNHLKRFFVDQNILTSEQIDHVLNSKSRYNALDIYALRDKALSDKLTPEELLKVIYQISKRRGFKSNRKVVEETDQQEGGAVTQALKANDAYLEKKSYKTVGEALHQDTERYGTHKRNKSGTYNNSFARADFIHELETIIKKQREHALKNISDQAIRELIYGIDNDGLVVNQSAVMYQRPFMTDELIKNMVGECTFEFEKGEKRAPRASHSFELFRLASELVHLTYIPKGSKKRDAAKNQFHHYSYTRTDSCCYMCS